MKPNHHTAEQICGETQKLADGYVRILLKEGGTHEDHDPYAGADHQDY